MSAAQDSHGFRDYIKQAVWYCTRPIHLRRTVTITLIVGTWLTLLNQSGVLWGGGWDVGLLVRVALNYLTPFIVSNLGLLSNAREKRTTGDPLVKKISKARSDTNDTPPETREGHVTQSQGHTATRP